MANRSTAPNPLEQRSALPNASTSSSVADRQPSARSDKKRTSTREETAQLGLPEHLRRSLPSRIDDILADPRSARCAEPCHICAKVPEDIADAALAEWDTLARSGAWPIRTTQVRANLDSGSPPIGYAAVRDLISHRRWTVLDRLVRKDIEAHKRQLKEAAAPPEAE